MSDDGTRPQSGIPAASQVAYDKAFEMYQREHDRWNQWAVFFFGSIASLILLYSQLNGRLSFTWMAVIGAFLSFVWICAGQSIRTTTNAWRDVLRKIEDGDTRDAYHLFEHCVREIGSWKDRLRDFGNSLAFWRLSDQLRCPWFSVTRLLVLIGFLSLVVFVYFAVASIVESPPQSDSQPAAVVPTDAPSHNGRAVSRANVITTVGDFLTPTIAVVAVYIAWQQHKTAQYRVRLDLYDRRYRVYRGLIDLLARAMENGGSESRQLIGDYYRETDAKRFLFDDDLCDYMKTVRESVTRLPKLHRQMDSANRAGDAVRQRAAEEEEAKVEKWLHEQVDGGAALRFRKYLDFKRL